MERRSFLKAIASVAALATLAPKELLAAPEPKLVTIPRGTFKTAGTTKAMTPWRLMAEHLERVFKAELDDRFQRPSLFIKPFSNGGTVDCLESTMTIGAKAYTASRLLVDHGGITDDTKCYGNCIMYSAWSLTPDEIGNRLEDDVRRMAREFNQMKA